MRVYAAILLAAALFVTSCRKSAAPAPTKDPNTTKKETPGVPDAKTGNNTGNSGLISLEIELPKPMFVGTPQNIDVPNLEKPLGKPRSAPMVPAGVTNISRGKPVKSSDPMPIIGELSMITDGDKEATDGSYVELGPGLQNVVIDLGGENNIYAIVIWHQHKQAGVYYDVIVQVADDPDFISNVQTLFNNDVDNSAGQGAGQDMHYVETNEGKLINGKGIKARYVRLYSNGNTQNELNQYIEVEVYGKPAQ